MSETPKAKTTAKKPATKKAVIADSTNADKPAKAVRKAPAKKTVTDAPVANVPVAKTAPVRKATPKVTGTPEVPAVAWVEIPATVARKSFWAKLKAFFTGK